MVDVVVHTAVVVGDTHRTKLPVGSVLKTAGLNPPAPTVGPFEYSHAVTQIC